MVGAAGHVINDDDKMRSVGDHDHDFSCSESSDSSLVKRNGFNRPVKNLIVLSQILIVLSKISIVLSQSLIVLFRISIVQLRIRFNPF